MRCSVLLRLEAPQHGLVGAHHVPCAQCCLIRGASPGPQVLGDHIDQKGSIVQPERLRFDFSHGGAIDGPTLGRIEALCRQAARDHQ